MSALAPRTQSSPRSLIDAIAKEAHRLNRTLLGLRNHRTAHILKLGTLKATMKPLLLAHCYLMIDDW